MEQMNALLFVTLGQLVDTLLTRGHVERRRVDVAQRAVEHYREHVPGIDVDGGADLWEELFDFQCWGEST